MGLLAGVCQCSRDKETEPVAARAYAIRGSRGAGGVRPAPSRAHVGLSSGAELAQHLNMALRGGRAGLGAGVRERELPRYLECWILVHGSTLARCAGCARAHLLV